jgi:murein DD-endopeptidase MepM/ murein hydrolase activator NlpD
MAHARLTTIGTAALGGVLAAAGVVVLAAGPAAAADHTVQPGESLVSIARQHGVSVGDLVRLNGLPNPDHLLVGTTLHVPSPPTKTKAKAKTPAKTSTAARGATRATPTKAEIGKGAVFSLTDPQRRQVDQLLQRAALEFGVSPSLLKALTYTESRWRQEAVSASGAIGVGQLLPVTATWLAGLMGEPGLDVRSAADNVRLSAKLLRVLLDELGGTQRALAAYYQGIGSVQRRGVLPSGARYAAIVAARQSWFR